MSVMAVANGIVVDNSKETGSSLTSFDANDIVTKEKDTSVLEMNTTTMGTTITWSNWYFSDQDRDGLNDTVDVSYDLSFNTTTSLNVSFLVNVYFLNGTLVDSLTFFLTASGGYAYHWFQWRAPYSADYWFKVFIYVNGKLDVTDEAYWYGADAFTPAPLYSSWWFSDQDYDGLNDTVSAGLDLYFLGINGSLNVQVFVDIFLYDQSYGNWLFYTQLYYNFTVFDLHYYHWFEWHAPVSGDYWFNVTVLADGTFHADDAMTWYGADAFIPPPFTSDWYYHDDDYDGINDSVTGDYEIYVNASLPANVSIIVDLYFWNAGWQYNTTFWTDLTSSWEYAYWSFYWQAPSPGDYLFNVTIYVDGSFRGSESVYFYGADKYEPPLIYSSWNATDLNGNGLTDTIEANFDVYFSSNLTEDVTVWVDVYYHDANNTILWYYSALSFNETIVNGNLSFLLIWSAPFVANFTFDVYISFPDGRMLWLDLFTWQTQESYYTVNVSYYWNAFDQDGDGYNDTLSVTIDIISNSSQTLYLQLYVDIYYWNATIGNMTYYDTLFFNVTISGGYDSITFQWHPPFAGDFGFELTLNVNATILWSDYFIWYGANPYSPMYTIDYMNYFWDLLDSDFDGLNDTFIADYEIQVSPRNDLPVSFIVDIYYQQPGVNASWNRVDSLNFSFTAFNGLIFQNISWQAPFNGTYRFDIVVFSNGYLIYNQSLTWANVFSPKIPNSWYQLYSWKEDQDQDNYFDTAVIAVDLHGSNIRTTVDVLAIVTVTDIQYNNKVDSFNVTLHFTFLGLPDEIVQQRITWHAPYSGDFNINVQFIALSSGTLTVSKDFAFFALNGFQGGLPPTTTTTVPPSNNTTTSIGDNQTNSTTTLPPAPTTVLTPGFTTTSLMFLLSLGIVASILRQRQKHVASRV